MSYYHFYRFIPVFLCLFLFACSDGETNSSENTNSGSVLEEYTPNGSIQRKEDKKIQVKSAVASSSQKGMGIENTIDGDRKTLYNAGWDITVENYFPVVMDYSFENVSYLDYCIYYPRTSGSNGNFEKVEVWYQTIDSEEFLQCLEIDLKGSSTPSVINFPEQLKKPRTVRFIVREKVTGNGAPVCSEMEFYQRGELDFDPYTVFADRACTTLRNGISEAELKDISNDFFRNMALSIFKETYPSIRIQEYKPYIDPEIFAAKYKISTYSLRDNPTGIYVEKDEDLIVMVEDLYGQNISLVVQDLEKGFDGDSYPLINGVNILPIKNKGLVYITYYTNEGNETPVKINIASGKVNGVFKKGESDIIWKKTLNNTVSKHLDVIGEHAHLTFPVESFKNYCKSGTSLLEIYDEIVKLEKDFAGLEISNHIYFIITYKEDAHMFATAYRTAYSQNTMKKICDEKQLISNIWGPAHEVGHVNQVRPGFRWAGTTEVTNNIHSLYVQTTFGEESRLLKKQSGYINSYEEAYSLILGPHVPHSIPIKEVFARLVPFWQLQLYYAKVKEKTDFYKILYTLIREDNDPPTDGDCQLEFVKKACIAANEDLTSFFEKWGFLMPVNMELDDYGKKSIVITEEQVKNVKNEISKLSLSSPLQPIEYITDANWELFKLNAALKIGTASRNGSTIQMSGWTNAIAYEIYDKGVLVQVSQLEQITLKKDYTQLEIFVVDTSGKRVKAIIK